MRPIVDREACIGCMRCEEHDPIVFKVIDGKSEVQEQDADGNLVNYADHRAAIEESINDCPVSAISWAPESEEEDSGETGLSEDPTVDTM